MGEDMVGFFPEGMTIERKNGGFFDKNCALKH